MKNYYRNITNFTKENMKAVITALMLAIAVICVVIITANNEDVKACDNEMSEETVLVEKSTFAEVMEEITVGIKANNSELHMLGNNEKETNTENTTEVKQSEKQTTEETNLKTAEEKKSNKTKKKKVSAYNKVNQTVYVIYNVNVRDSANGNKVGYLYAGDKVKRTGVGTNGWSRIEYDGKTSYVYSYYLTTNKAQITEGIKTQEVQSATVSASLGKVSNKLGIKVTSEDYKWFLQIVQAEAGNQDEKGRILVANTIINRVKSSDFPSTITGVIFQKSGGTYQFSPVKNGTIYSVNVDQTTINCVNRALNGENYSSEVLYFSSEHSAYSWHNTSLAYLFTYGAHAFYR